MDKQKEEIPKVKKEVSPLTKEEKKDLKIKKKEEKKKRKEWKKEQRKKSFLFIFLHVITSFIKFCFISIGVCLVGAVVAFAIIWPKVEPQIVSARETAYDKLVNISPDDFQLASNTMIYDKDNNPIGEINSGSFEYVEISQVSPYIQNGYIAVEDRNFKTHFGIDIKANIRAAIALIKNRGEITQGASTITQQVIKNNLLTKDQIWSRKITEIFIAIDFEKEFSKEQIMEFYVNTNFYGNNCYGVEAASKYYFGVPAKDVSIAQAATLIGISNAPSKYNPISHYEDCMDKKEFVLGIMKEVGVITEEQYANAMAEEIVIQKYTEEIKGSTSWATTYALHCATEKLMEIDGFNFQYTFETKEAQNEYDESYNELYTEKYQELRGGGYEIHTSIDSNIQLQLQETIDNGLLDYTETKEDGTYSLQSAGVTIDNTTNFIVAIVGGRSNSGEFNRAYQGVRQPGSSIKPLVVYAPAFETGLYYPSLILKDEEIIGDYSPVNAGNTFSGNMTIRDAITKSTNTIAFKVLDGIGIETGLSYLAKMQFSDLSYIDNTTPSICLGGFTNGTTPVDMAKGYNTLANNGNYSNRTCLVSIKASGDILFEDSKDETTQIFSPDTAFMVTDCLKDVVTSGTGRNARIKGQVVAGKTGTTNSNKDAWFCGYTKYYTTSIWVGYDTPKSMNSISGGNLPTIIWQDFMETLHFDLQESDWEEPDTIRRSYYNEFGKPTSDDTGVRDYFSTLNSLDLMDNALAIETINENNYLTAKVMVEDFETLTINDLDSAIEFRDMYERTNTKVNEVLDEYLSSELRIRLVNRYNEMYDVYYGWQTAIDEHDANIEQQKQLEQELKDNEAAISQLDYLKQVRISNVQYYINILNNMTNYTTATVNGISALQNAVARLGGYAEYQTYYDQSQVAIQRANGLPRVETPSVPQDENDIPVQ